MIHTSFCHVVFIQISATSISIELSAGVSVFPRGTKRNQKNGRGDHVSNAVKLWKTHWFSLACLKQRRVQVKEFDLNRNDSNMWRNQGICKPMYDMYDNEMWMTYFVLTIMVAVFVLMNYHYDDQFHRVNQPIVEPVRPIQSWTLQCCFDSIGRPDTKWLKQWTTGLIRLHTVM